MKDKIYEELNFKDWIQLKEWNDPDWIILSKFTSGVDSFWTHSVLLHLDRMGDIEESVPKPIKSITQKTILKLLFSENYLDNNLHENFGIPDILYRRNGIIFNDEYVDKRELKFRPFIYTVEYNEGGQTKNNPIEITPCPEFCTLYRLRRKPLSYTRIDRMGKEVEVIRIGTKNNPSIMKMSTKYLRDFLSLSNMALVRIHSHQRVRNEEFKEEEHTDKDDLHFYRIMVANGVFLESHEQGVTRSLLRGIDVILPYTNPINENRVLGPRPKPEVKFIIGRNEDGTNKTMNPQDTAHTKGTFKLHVCFNKEVLQKFYQKPEIYKISEGSGIDGPDYYLPYNNTPENSIMVYLGDLKGLPFEELLYFRGYNILCPKISITVDRFRRDILAEFAEPRELEHQLKTNLNELNRNFKKRFSFPLFKLDHPDVMNNLAQIRVPLTRESKEYNDVVLATNKVFVESISSKELKNVIRDSTQMENLKSLKLLEKFLVQEFPGLESQIKYLFYLYDLRNTLAAHLSGKKYQEFLIDHNFKENETIEIIEWLLKGILTFLKEFNSSLSKSAKKTI